jgi:drug/metabolite transporter (DMT)-like permease
MTNHTALPAATLPRDRTGASERWLVVLGFLAIYGIWSSTYLAIRYTVEAGAPFLAAGLRVMIAGAILYGWRRGLGAIVEGGQWRATWISGSLMFLGGYGLLFWAEQHVPSGVAALLLAAIPLWVVLFERRPWDWPTGIGLVMGLAGIATLAGPDTLRAAGISGTAVAALLGSGAAWAAGTSYSH